MKQEEDGCSQLFTELLVGCLMFLFLCSSLSGGGGSGGGSLFFKIMGLKFALNFMHSLTSVFFDLIF